MSHPAKLELVRRGATESLVAVVNWVLDSPFQRLSAQERGRARERFREPTGGAARHDPEQRPWQVWQTSIQREALQCLAAMAAHPTAKAALAEKGAVRAALRIVEADGDAGGDATLLAQQIMTSLSVGEGLEAILVEQGVAEALVGVLASDGYVPDDERACALNTLTNLCAGNEATRGELISRGVAEALLAILGAPPASPSAGGDLGRTQAALALMNLTATADLPSLLSARDAAGPEGGPGLLRRAAQVLLDAARDGGGGDRQRYACVAAANFAAHREFGEVLLECGALAPLAAFLSRVVATRRAGPPPADDPVPVVLAGVAALSRAGPVGEAAAAAYVAAEPEVVAGLRERAAGGCPASRAALDALLPAPSGRASGADTDAHPADERPAAAAECGAAEPAEQKQAAVAGPAPLGWKSVVAATAGWSEGRRAGSGAYIGDMGGEGGIRGPALCVVRRLRALAVDPAAGAAAEERVLGDLQRLQAQLCDRSDAAVAPPQPRRMSRRISRSTGSRDSGGSIGGSVGGSVLRRISTPLAARSSRAVCGPWQCAAQATALA